MPNVTVRYRGGGLGQRCATHYSFQTVLSMNFYILFYYNFQHKDLINLSNEIGKGRGD